LFSTFSTSSLTKRLNKDKSCGGKWLFPTCKTRNLPNTLSAKTISVN
jgi:hypothetical protein